MKLTRTWLSVVTVAVAVIATACGGSTGGSTNPADQTGTLTVWLMNGSAPQSVIDSVNADFNAKYPKVTSRSRSSNGATSEPSSTPRLAEATRRTSSSWATR